MQITDVPVEGFERVAKAVDPVSGLHAFICVHDTTLGPALGGLRMWAYESENEALFDVKRLAVGMTNKSAVAQTGLGGGKAVILGKPTIKSEALYLAMGQFIEAFDGSYITAEDVNTGMADLEIIRRATQHVTGFPRASGGCGDPSPFTAYGVFLGIQAAVEWVHGSPELAGRRVAVQGVGSVGSELVRRLAGAGAEVLVADRRTERAEALAAELGVQPVDEDEILFADVDVLAPCALGAVINDDTVPKLRCRVVAGAANNLLLDLRHGHMLAQRGILYAPDYVINAGGIIHIAVSREVDGYDEQASNTRTERIPEALREVWSIARDDGIPPSEAAERLAERILEGARATP